jgi:hypothetical protein
MEQTFGLTAGGGGLEAQACDVQQVRTGRQIHVGNAVMRLQVCAHGNFWLLHIQMAKVLGFPKRGLATLTRQLLSPNFTKSRTTSRSRWVIHWYGHAT